MPSELDLIVCKTSLVAPVPNNSGFRQASTIVLGMVGDEELLVLRIALEALEAVPCHILEREQCTVRRQDVVKISDADESVVSVLDHALQDTVLSGAKTLVHQGLVVGCTAEHIDRCALVPIRVCGGMEGGFDVTAVEVHLRARWIVVSGVNDAKLGVRMRAGLGDMVDVEAWIDFEYRRVNVVEDVAGVIAIRVWIRVWIWKDWNWTRLGREGEVLIDVRRVVAVTVCSQ